MYGKIGLITLMEKNSKRFPGKNIHPFLGMPLYMHTVNFALATGLPYHIITNYSAVDLPVPLPESVCVHPKMITDHKTSEEISALNLDFDIYVILQVTSPLRSLTVFKSVLEHFIAGTVDVATSVKMISNKYCYMEGVPVNFSACDRDYNGTERKTILYETGAYYIFRKSQLEQKHILSFDSPETKVMFFEDTYEMDIDRFEDLHSVEERIKQ